MASIDILAKNNGQIIQSLNTNSVVLNQNSVVKIGVKIDDVANILREGNAAVITLKNGEKIVVENYFDPAVNESLLVFEGNNGELYWAEFTDSSGQMLDVVKYNPITEEALLGGGATDLLPWIGGALAVGGIAAAVGGSGGSSSSNNSTPQNPADNAEKLVSQAETTYQNALEILEQAQQDGLITPEEQQAVQDAIDAAAEAKNEAQDAVNVLPDGADKDDLQDRLDAINDPITLPPVNDADGNGIDDEVDTQIDAVEGLVVAAEQAYQNAVDALEVAESNNLITPTEQAALEDALEAAQQAKADAQAAVNALPAEVQEAIDGFQDRLDALTDITIPAINDANENGIDDSTEDPLDLANDLVDAAEAAYQSAEEALGDANADGLITPEEQTALEDTLKDAQDAKDLAQDAVNALPAGTDRDGLQGRLDSLVDIVVPPVNDADSDGVEDTVAEQAATVLVEGAEAAQEAAEDLLAELQEDGLITPAE
ncbi:GA-like domain-containing protein, partial [Acinetobacter schindleri]